MIRLGLIGCGNFSRMCVQPLNSLRDLVQVTACADLRLDRAKTRAAQFPGARAYERYHDMLGDVDAVYAPVSHHVHVQVAIDCLEAGKHVLVEKPLANSEAEALAMIDAADRSGRVLMVAYPLPYLPLVQEVARHIRERTWGNVFQASIWTEQYTNPQKDDATWQGTIAQLGGGQLFSHGCHYIDLLLRWLGEPVEGSHIGTNFASPWMEREGTSLVALKFASGAVAYHGGTWAAQGTKLGYAMHVHFEQGMLEYDLWEGTLNFYKGGPHISKTREVTELLKHQRGCSTEYELRHFLECVASGARPMTDARRSLQSLRVIWRLYEAEAQRRVADLRGLGLAAPTARGQDQEVQGAGAKAATGHAG